MSKNKVKEDKVLNALNDLGFPEDYEREDTKETNPGDKRWN